MNTHSKRNMKIFSGHSLAGVCQNIWEVLIKNRLKILLKQHFMQN